MEFPLEIQNLINEYAKPITRPDWKEGCYFSRQPFYFFVTYGELIEELVNEFNNNNDEINYSDDDSEFSAFSDYEIEE